MELYEKVYNYGSILFVILYVVTIIGVWRDSPKYLQIVDDIFKIFIGLLLIYIFNPMSKQPVTQFHKKIVFSAGIMILLSSSFKSLLQYIPIIPHLITELKV